MDRNDSQRFAKSFVERVTEAFSLIALGIFFLLNTTNTIPWSAWGTVFLIFVRIWPVFIIIAGLHIMFGKNFILSSLINIASTLVFVGVLAVAAWLNTNDLRLKGEFERSLPFIPELEEALNKDRTTKNLNIPLSNHNLEALDQQEINIELTNEDFEIRDETTTSFADLEATYNNQQEPYLNSRTEDTKVIIDTGINYNDEFRLLTTPAKLSYNLGNTNLNTDLNIKMTSGNGKVNLEKLDLKSLLLEQTSGNISANLSMVSPETINIELTSGNIDLVLPENVSLRINYSKTSGNIRIDGKTVNDNNGIINVSEASDQLTNVILNVTSGNINLFTE